MGFSIFTDLLFISMTFSFAGKILLGIMVINVHAHVVKERKIDENVLTYMKKERVYGFLGIIFIALGYLLELVYLGYIF